MTRIILILITLLTCDAASAQYAYFATRGKITYDKVTYTRAKLRDMQQQMQKGTQARRGGAFSFDLEQYPESNTETYVLDFDENTTLMYVDTDKKTNSSENGKNQTTAMRGGAMRGGSGQGGGNGNRQGVRVAINASGRSSNSSRTLFQNLQNKTTEVQVEIDDKYLITDSLSEITWRFSDEYRTIAGYECRRVNGATKDSLYLIAFYTDEIPVSAGPALTHGLPGMILGLVIPEMHVQYWATKVDYSTDIVQKDWRDKKTKKITLDEFINSFGRFFQRMGDSNSSRRQVQESLIY